jgi:hypothetical protein
MYVKLVVECLSGDDAMICYGLVYYMAARWRRVKSIYAWFFLR